MRGREKLCSLRIHRTNGRGLGLLHRLPFETGPNCDSCDSLRLSNFWCYVCVNHKRSFFGDLLSFSFSLQINYEITMCTSTRGIDSMHRTRSLAYTFHPNLSRYRLSLKVSSLVLIRDPLPKTKLTRACMLNAPPMSNGSLMLSPSRSRRRKVETPTTTKGLFLHCELGAT